MNSRRVAVAAGLIGVLGAVGKFLPGLLFDSILGEGLPSWLPMLGTAGTTVTFYVFLNAIFGGLFILALSAGFGYWRYGRMDLRREYGQFIKALVAGTTLPLLAVWVVGLGGFVVGLVDGFSMVMLTMIPLRLFATVSLPVVLGMFGGSVLSCLKDANRSPSEPSEANAGDLQLSD